jgi:hypothetical protein
MKLTKGKIRKLLLCKNQTRKVHASMKVFKNNVSFKNKQIHYFRSTIKNINNI